MIDCVCCSEQNYKAIIAVRNNFFIFELHWSL